jgi:hypothetical protein
VNLIQTFEDRESVKDEQADTQAVRDLFNQDAENNVGYIA